MNNNSLLKRSLLLLLFSCTLLFLTSCGDDDDDEAADTPLEVTKANLEGTWTGTLGGIGITLKVDAGTGTAHAIDLASEGTTLLSIPFTAVEVDDSGDFAILNGQAQATLVGFTTRNVANDAAAAAPAAGGLPTLASFSPLANLLITQDRASDGAG